MKNKLLIYPGLILFFVLSVAGNVHSQNFSLKIKNVDGTEKEIGLTDLKRITFQDSNMNLTYSDSRSELLSIAVIQQMLFTTATGIVSNFEPTFNLYPNPTANYLHINNLTLSKEPVSIYNTSGVMVKRADTSSGTQRIDVSDLPKGLYFVRVNNQIQKFIKL